LQQRVPEGVALSVRVWDEHVVLDRLAQREVEVGLVQSAGGGQQPVADGLAGHSGHAKDLPGRARQRIDAGGEQVVHGGRQHQGAAGRPGGEQFLGEEGVALRPREHLVDQPCRRRGPQNACQQSLEFSSAQAVQLEPLDARVAAQLGQPRPQRVAAARLVAAVGGQQHDGGLAEARHQERQQVQRGAIGPVQVLHG
jgi:hypothetical protein